MSEPQKVVNRIKNLASELDMLSDDLDRCFDFNTEKEYQKLAKELSINQSLIRQVLNELNTDQLSPEARDLVKHLNYDHYL